MAKPNNKNEKAENFEAVEQDNRRHRGKSNKLQKREDKRKSKKKNKKQKHYIHNIQKAIKAAFKAENKYIHFDSLPFDLEDIEKYIRKLLATSKDATTEIPALIENMEENEAEVDISAIEDVNVQKYLVKLFKKLKIYSIGFKNPFIFKIPKVNRGTNLVGSKKHYTTDDKEIISDSLESYSLFLKGFFEFVEAKMKEEKETEGAVKQKVLGYHSYGEESDNEANDEDSDAEYDDSEINRDYEEVEQTVGNNAELINKSFDKIMRDDLTNSKDLLNKKKHKEEVLAHSKNLKNRNIIISEKTSLLENNINQKNNLNDLLMQEENNDDDISDEDEDEEQVGPSTKDFLKSTFSLLEEGEDFDSFINRTTTDHAKKYGNKSLVNPEYAIKKQNENKKEKKAINQDIYDKIMAEEDNRMKKLEAEIKEHDKLYRNKSLLHEHQIKKEKEKEEKANTKKKNDISQYSRFNNTNNNDNQRGTVIDSITSKKTLNMLQQFSGLKNRFSK